MKYEYNGNLLENDRIDLVAKEIMGDYPQISERKAKEAAMLEGKISTNKTINDELNRLYNIMLVDCENKELVITIYKDFLKLLKNRQNEISENYVYLAKGISDYLKEDDDFPFLSDYQ
jgi:hypothetical protein